MLRIVGYDYDRVRAIADGGVGIAGVDVSFDVESIYAASQYAFGPDKKYEITEIGLMPFVQRYVNDGFRAYTLVPVFLSRIFRHRNIFVHVDSGIEKPEDLRGKRVGTPGYGFSANTWIRGFLLDEYGVAADDMQWIQTTASSDTSYSPTDRFALRRTAALQSKKKPGTRPGFFWFRRVSLLHELQQDAAVLYEERYEDERENR